jgi:hypothetical protein
MGRREAPFQHDTSDMPGWPSSFETIHMALIPKGPDRGSVIVFDASGNQPQQAWVQRWAIVDVSGPGSPGFQNGELVLAPGGGDFFCSAETWTADGDLLVVGGTAEYAVQPGGNYFGGRLAYMYDPDAGTWTQLRDMAADRWYPTVVRITDGRMLVLGGTHDLHGHFHNNYQIFSPPYLNCHQPRPVIVSAPATLTYNDRDPAAYTITFEGGPGSAHVDRAVLMAPGSVTHHSDFGQRHVTLPIVGRDATSIHVQAPANGALAPPGHYMLFLVSDLDVPSVATWVYIS